MQAKKTKKKKKASESRDKSVVQEESFDSPQIEKHLRQFSVTIDKTRKYSKWLKTQYAVLLHPSIMKLYGSPEYFVVIGESKQALFVPYSLKTIKDSCIVFPNFTCDFTEQEKVTLQPYSEIETAAQVTIRLNKDVAVNEEVKNSIGGFLYYKKYVYKGLTLTHGSQNPLDFTIMDISGSKTFEQDSLHATSFNSTLFRTPDKSNLSFNDPSYRETKFCLETGDISNKSINVSSNLNSMFSSMTLNESENHSSFLDVSFDQSMHFEISVPLYFIVSPETKLDFCSASSGKEPSKSVHGFSDIAGLKKEIQNIRTFLDTYLYPNNSLHCVSVGFLMLYGPSGTGKTLVMKAIENEYPGCMEKIALRFCNLSKTNEVKEIFQGALQRARKREPCIILMDDFNLLCPAQNDSQSSNFFKVMSHLIENCVGKRVVFVASTNSEYDADMLRIYNAVIERIHFRMPDTGEREEIFSKILNLKAHSLSPEQIKECAMLSQGFTGRDINGVISGAFMLGKTIQFEDIRSVLKSIKPSITGSNIQIKEVRWSDIGGMHQLKEKLKDIVEGPLKHPDVYKRFNIKSARGILLFGPPGCSKTMIAKALATECALNFVSKNVSDIHNKYVGESEKAVRNLFALARAKSPCIIFLDEVDALAPNRGSSSGSGVEERIVNSFLQEMDGIEELHNVIIVAATNRPDKLDQAFVRHGRFNHFIYVPLPDLQAREEILKLQMKNRITDENFSYEYLASKTDGYSGAELVNICNEATTILLMEEDIENDPVCVFTLNHFEAALKSIPPRTTKDMLKCYDEYNSGFRVS